MRKIAEQNIFKDAYEELNSDDKYTTSVIDKTAFDITATPGALIGALTGALVAGNKAKAEVIKSQMENDNTKSLSGNYYSQVQNIAQGLRVIFTPLGVTYTVKNRGREVSLETIETEEMNKDMYAAWQHRDEQYFKYLLLNKMHTELQMVEQHFAKKFLENQLHLQNQISKKASEDPDLDVESISDIEMFSKIAEIKDFYGRKTPATEKLAEIMLKVMDDGTTYKVSWHLDRPFDKYAGLADKLSFLGFGDGSTNIKKYIDPNFLINKVQIGFMPDRVIFTVENKIISTLNTTHMSEEAFKHFEVQDKEYFTKLFKSEVSQGLKRMGGKIPPNSLIIEKKASADNIADIFTRTDIHPMVYFLVLTRQYTAQWMTWESAALVKIIETDFNLTEGIEDIALNKILSIQVANRSDAVYTQHHAFEKVIRAFNDRPIDFFDREINDMTMEDLAFGLLTLQQVTPHDDIFELFSQNVWNHMIDILLADENKIFYPVALIEDKEGNGEKFIEKLNDILLDGANAQDTKNVNDMAIASKAIQENELICRIGLELLTKLRGMKTDYNTIDDEKFISVMLDKINIPLEDRIKEIIKKHILKNIEMDIFLEGQQLRLKRQSNEFQL